jgi:hypothetical protein
MISEDDGFDYINSGTIKRCITPTYNYVFNSRNGLFMRWGKTIKDDPLYSPIGPEIADIEISVNGCPNGCPFCYKGNTNAPATNMSFETFKIVIDKMPSVTQVAFGICGVQTNPDFIKMLKYCREIGVVPNFTLSGIDLSDDMANEIVKHVGAVAVSAYESDKNVCYNTVKKFIDLGIKQTNIHLCYYKENMDFVYEVINDSLTDERLKNLNAIVLLKMKPKGRAKNRFTILDHEEFTKLVDYCLSNNIKIGFDSCTASSFEKAVNESTTIDDKRKKQLIMMSDSCESLLSSIYVNYKGDVYACSFCEDEEGWEEGISVIDCKDFLGDVWYHEKVKKWRSELLSTCYSSGCRRCLMFDINP